MNGRFNAGSEWLGYNLHQNAPNGRSQQMGRTMKTKFLTTLLGLAIVAIPAVASQPEVKLADLKPTVQLTMSDLDLAMLLTDPRQEQDLSIVLPTGFTMLEAIDQDPFRS
jgi:hypothetical protein